ncbi:MAG: hypothetical protein M3Q48_11160 [Actinomycetota bacterium]|nr:hypothetical protein [Actinomycetota bacterium]
MIRDEYVVGVAGAELEAMQRISRGERARRLAAASLVLTGAASFLTGTVFGGASLAAPSAVLELDADVRSDGATDWAHAGGATGSGGVFEGGTFVDDTTPPAPPALTAAGRRRHRPGLRVHRRPPLVRRLHLWHRRPHGVTGAGGEKNGDRLDGMTFGTSSVPSKDDLSNVCALALDRGTTTEVLFGAERVTNDGDSHIGLRVPPG